MNNEKSAGFISGDNKDDIFFVVSDIIETDRLKPIHARIRVRFIPVTLGTTTVAREIEIL